MAMLTLLPAASLTACLVWSLVRLRWLRAKLRRGGRTGVRWVYGSTRGPPARQEDVAHNRGQRRVDANAEGVQDAGRKEKGPRHEMCSLLTQVEMCKEGRKGANVSTGADTKTNTVGRRRT